MNVELRRPCMELAASFAEMRDAFSAAGEDAWSAATNLAATAIAHSDVAAYVELVNGWGRGVNLPSGWVSQDAFWIVVDGRVAGEIGVRHELNDRLRQVGGHVGYLVHPGFRNRGIATVALREALNVLATFDVREALVTCLDDNAASIRVVEKCGGTRLADSTAPGPKRRRYVIMLATDLPMVFQPGPLH